MMELKTFAVAVYSETGVAEACLTLQDQNHVDVPLLLFCGWYGVYYGQLSSHLLKQAQDISQHVGVHLIKPLRKARRWMKTHSVPTDAGRRWEALREDVKRTELNAELLMLDTLANMVEASAGDAGANFMASLSGQPNQQDVILHNMRRLLSASKTSGSSPAYDTPDTSDTSDTGDTAAHSGKELLELISTACFNAAHVRSTADH